MACRKVRSEAHKCKMAALDVLVAHARKIEDRESLDAAIDMQIDEARAFVNNWNATVTPGRQDQK